MNKNNITKLPPGFRFQPTDEELVFQYLKCKIFAFPLPASIIPDIASSFSSYHHPRDFPGEFEQDRYFFSNKEVKNRIGSIRINTATPCGYWKATGVDKKIVSSSRRNHQMLGMRKTLVFYNGKPRHGSKTDWIMHEYRLIASPCHSSSIQHEMGNWVLCHVFMKKRRNVKNEEETIIQVPSSSSSSSCCSSSSSTITEEEASSRGPYFQESSSS